MWQSFIGAGVLVVQDGRVLMVAHERDGLTRWELPSGIVEAREALEVAAARETLEETGVSVAVGPLLCTVVMDVFSEGYRGINVYFRANAISDAQPRPPSNEPISCAAYVDVSRLSAKDIHPVDRRILNMWRRKPDRSAFYIHIAL